VRQPVLPLQRISVIANQQLLWLAASAATDSFRIESIEPISGKMNVAAAGVSATTLGTKVISHDLPSSPLGDSDN